MEDKQLNFNHYFSPSTLEEWRQAVETTLKGRSSDRLVTKTYEGFPRQPLYTAATAQVPQEAPHSSARYHGALDRRQAGWDIRQLHDTGTLEEAHAAIQADLKRGVRSLWLSPASSSLPGLPLHHIDDLRQLLASVDLYQTPITLQAGAYGLPWWSILTQVATETGLKGDQIIGSIHADPLGEFAQTGSLPVAWEHAWDDLAQLLQASAQQTPWLHTFSVSTLPYHNAGAHTVQELAYLLASTVEMMRACEARNVDLDTLAGRCTIQLGVGRDLFLEIAKIRASRLLWAKLWNACSDNDQTQAVFIHACTSLTTQTQRDPWVNLLRGTAETFAAAIGGADAITLIPFDRALGTPDALARRIASNTQIVLEKESHLARVIDPSGGSWYIETLTQTLAQQAWSHFQTIEAQGGMRHALENGAIAREIEAVRQQRNIALSKRKEPLVGVSEFAHLQETALQRTKPVSSAPPNGSKLSPLQGSLEALQHAAQQGASVQDLLQALHPSTTPVKGQPLPSYRLSENWEALRNQSDTLLQIKGQRPSVFLANLGPIPAHKARATFAQRFFEAGGFDVHTNDGFSEMKEAVKAFQASKAQGLVICGRDEDYLTYIPELTTLVAPHNPAFLALAGRMGEQKTDWTQRGLTHAIYLGCDALATLHQLQTIAGDAS